MRLYTSELVKKYKARTVVDHVSIDVNQGEIVGLLGPNGAGKTTTFYMIVGLIKPNEGRIFLENDEGQVAELTNEPVYKRAQMGVGYLAQEASVFRRLSVEDNLRAVLEMTEYSKEYQAERVESLIEEFRLQKVRKSLGIQLSGGERRRAALCAALIASYEFAGFAYGRPKAIKSIFWSQFAAFLCITALPDDRAGGQQLMLAAIAGILLFQSYLTASNIRPAVSGPVGGAQ